MKQKAGSLHTEKRMSIYKNRLPFVSVANTQRKIRHAQSGSTDLNFFYVAYYFNFWIGTVKAILDFRESNEQLLYVIRISPVKSFRLKTYLNLYVFFSFFFFTQVINNLRFTCKRFHSLRASSLSILFPKNSLKIWPFIISWNVFFIATTLKKLKQCQATTIWKYIPVIGGLNFTRIIAIKYP